MNQKKKLKLLLVCILLFITALIGYRINLFIHESDYESLNADHIGQIEARLADKDSFKFAVVGNIRNSMGIFRERILPFIRDNDVDFIISAGNAVYDGAEDRYRLLYRGLQKLDIPYVLAVGHNEIEDFGASKFYRHFGPYFFSFHLKNAYFIFLDSTGQTSWKWQMRWLKQELETSEKYPNRFVVLCHALFALPGIDPDAPRYVLEKNRSRDLQRLFSQYHVTMVFSAGYPTYYSTEVRGVEYVVSGCGGGFMFVEGSDNYQFAKVDVSSDGVSCENVAASQPPGTLQYRLENIELFLHSFFYMSLFNFLLVLGVISLIVLKVYSLIVRHKHLYRDFSIDEEAMSKEPLRVAIFSNNYLPFIGGVPLSIDRLYRGLIQADVAVKLFAPAYRRKWPDPQDGSVVRCPALFHTRTNNLVFANIFARKIDTEFKNFGCNLVHVHHPFWLGTKGMRLARKRGIPVVFTYHTRMERYTHYIPLPFTAIKNLVAHFLIKHFANRCDAIITPTSSTEEYLRNLGVSALIETIPTGISIGDYGRWSVQQIRALRSRYVTPGQYLLISVSRIAKEKNLDFLIDGLAKVKNRTDRPFKCLLVGDGPEKDRLEGRTAKLGIDDNVIFAGNIAPDELVGCYLAADFFVFASTSETQGMVLLEAMAGGCPVVAVRASGVYDVVKDDYNGFKVPESTDDWAETVANLLEDGECLSVLSENSRAFAENYSLEKVTEQVLRLYRRALLISKSQNGK
jgi:glycosyltransferase involved in cell wall biosynthesis